MRKEECESCGKTIEKYISQYDELSKEIYFICDECYVSNAKRQIAIDNIRDKKNQLLSDFQKKFTGAKRV